VELADIRKAVYWGVGALVVLNAHPTGLLWQLIITIVASVAGAIT